MEMRLERRDILLTEDFLDRLLFTLMRHNENISKRLERLERVVTQMEQIIGKTSFSEEREFIVDVMETSSEIRVIAELPSVQTKDLKLWGAKKSLVISVDTQRLKYRREVELPTKVNFEKMKVSYKNGVLEVILPKK